MRIGARSGGRRPISAVLHGRRVQSEAEHQVRPAVLLEAGRRAGQDGNPHALHQSWFEILKKNINRFF